MIKKVNDSSFYLKWPIKTVSSISWEIFMLDKSFVFVCFLLPFISYGFLWLYKFYQQQKELKNLEKDLILKKHGQLMNVTKILEFHDPEKNVQDIKNKFKDVA